MEKPQRNVSITKNFLRKSWFNTVITSTKLYWYLNKNLWLRWYNCTQKQLRTIVFVEIVFYSNANGSHVCHSMFVLLGAFRRGCSAIGIKPSFIHSLIKNASSIPYCLFYQSLFVFLHQIYWCVRGSVYVYICFFIVVVDVENCHF